MRGTLRQFAALVTATAGPYLAEDVPERAVRMGGLSLVGAIERVTIEWQEGELDATFEEVVDYLVAFFLAAAASFGMGRG